MYREQYVRECVDLYRFVEWEPVNGYIQRIHSTDTHRVLIRRVECGTVVLVRSTLGDIHTHLTAPFTRAPIARERSPHPEVARVVASNHKPAVGEEEWVRVIAGGDSPCRRCWHPRTIERCGDVLAPYSL